MAEMTIAEQIAELESAIASGAMAVTYNGKKVEYRSLAQMNQILAQLKAKQDGRPRRRRRYASYRSGC